MKCKTCGKNADSEYCFVHKPKKPLCNNKGLNRGKMNDTSYSKAPGRDNGRFIIQKEMFLNIWKKRPHKSEVSGAYLGSEPMSTYFHHILAKEKYPEACLDEENIVLLSLLEHSNVENDMYKYEEINDRRKHLLKKYERS